MAARDPSYGVPPQLLPHLHLLSTYHYPVTQSLHGDAALNYLISAPRIVRQMAPMVWQYLSTPPHDGMVFLAWQPSAQRGNRFASDGYIWADPEHTYHFEIRGYQIEVLVHRSGYRPNMDTMSCHARHRYHIINKMPHITEDFDPNLWIVHWGPADAQSRLPVQQVRIHPEVHQIMRERGFIESKGPLQRKEFMLYDAAQWPTVNFGAPMQHQIPPRAQQFYQPPPGADDPRVKRPRVEPPPGAVAGRARGPSMGMPYDASIEDEEYTQFGDFLDHLTPREISTLRFKQHHEWFEEIFSSVYTTAQILPEDLGLGLAGDLEDLTRGILEAPNVRVEQGADKPPPGRLEVPTRRYQKLDKEQMDDLDKRINDFIEKGQAEIRAMKSEHTKKLQDPKRNIYRAAERKLREASRMPNATSSVDEIVHQVETELNVRFLPKQDSTCVEKGGLEEEQKFAPPPQTTNGANGDVHAANGDGLFNELDGIGGDLAELGANDDSAAGLLDQYGSGSYQNTPGSDALHIPTPQLEPGQTSTEAPTTAAPAADAPQQDDFEMHEGETGLDNPPEDSGLDFLEGMDLDAPIGEDQTGEETAADQPLGGEDDWVVVNDKDETAAEAPAITEAAGESALATEQQEQQEQPAIPATDLAAVEAGPTIEATEQEVPTTGEHAAEDTVATQAAADEDIFGDITADGDNFNDFDIDETAADDLANYTGGGDAAGDDLGLTLGNSTFEDAFEATDLEHNEGQEHAEGAGEEGA